MYAPYVVQQYPNIPSLCCIHRQPSRLPYSISPHLFPPEVHVTSSKSMNERRRNRRNQRSNKQIMKRIKAMNRKRVENQDLVEVSVHGSQEA